MQPNTLTLSILESHLWEAANILRGSPVDRTDWKSYILPLMFFKRIVNQFEEIQDRARVVALSQIKEEDWTLNISRYVLPPIGEDIPPLDVAIEDFKSAWGRTQKAENRLRNLLKDNGIGGNDA